MTSRLTTTAMRSERAEASLAERTALSERMIAAYEKGGTISIDIAQDPHNLEKFTRYAEQYGGDTRAAQALMAAELTRQSLKANRMFSVSSALPTSFGDIQVQHRQEKADTTLNPAIDDRHRSNDRQASRLGRSARKGPTYHQRHHRQDKRCKPEAQRCAAGAKADQTGADAKAEIVENNGGTLASKKSLLKQSGKQVFKEAESTEDNATGIVKDLPKSDQAGSSCTPLVYGFKSASGGFMKGGCPVSRQ
ncbi:hypothetical protein [Cupriavidus necator]